MAYLYKLGDVYYIRFSIGGKRKAWSLWTEDEPTARRLARRLQRAYKAGKYNPMTTSAGKFLKREETVWRPSWESGKSPATSTMEDAQPETLEGQVEAFLRTRRHLKKNTYVHYRRVLGLFIARGGHVGSMFDGLALETKHGYKRTLKTFYRWLIKKGWASYNPMDDILLPRRAKRIDNYYTREEVNQVLKAIYEQAAPEKASWMAAMIIFCCYTGLRVSEVARLRWDQLQNNHIVFPAGETKSGRPEKTYMPPPAREALAALPPSYREGECVFGGHTSGYYSRHFARWRDQAGINRGTFHWLRHTCASWMIQDGFSLMDVRDHLRHASLQMTELYGHLSPSTYAERMEKWTR